jgi:hypothetical protein
MEQVPHSRAAFARVGSDDELWIETYYQLVNR